MNRGSPGKDRGQGSVLRPAPRLSVVSRDAPVAESAELLDNCERLADVWRLKLPLQFRLTRLHGHQLVLDRQCRDAILDRLDQAADFSLRTCCPSWTLHLKRQIQSVEQCRVTERFD